MGTGGRVTDFADSDERRAEEKGMEVQRESLVPVGLGAAFLFLRMGQRLRWSWLPVLPRMMSRKGDGMGVSPEKCA